MSKRTRQQAILEIVRGQQVPSQAALAQQLSKNGFNVTQATLSRDIADLNLMKSKGGYTTLRNAGAADMPQMPDPTGTLRRLVTRVDQANNLVVVKTSPGSAQPVALAIDDGRYKEILGTVAGDDVVLVVTRVNNDARSFVDRISQLLD